MLEDKGTNQLFYEYFEKYWIPIYRKQIQEAKIENDEEALIEIFENLNKNWNLKLFKTYIFKKLGIYYLHEQQSNLKKSIDPKIINIYFNYKKRKENEIWK